LPKIWKKLVEEPIVYNEEKIENLPVLEIPEDQLFIDVKSIEFLLNKFDIENESAEELDKVVKFMKEHPTVIVEFSSHTDSRGPDDWNMELTNMRANEVVSYIVGKGIDYRRIYGKGYGETLPVNHCVNGVECTELEHLQNRRTEFLILAR
jgi:peptidoglycan-associated lipoprotein